MTAFVYILANRRQGTLYTGVCRDLSRRVWEHREGHGSEFAEKWGCAKLVWYDRFERFVDAIAYEKRVKKWRRTWKIDLIEKANPDWRDLYLDMGGWTGR